MIRERQISVIGGGIGGMAAALALARKGGRVTLFERAGVLQEAGAGIQISVNGQRVLRALGVVGNQPPEQASVSPGTVIRDGASGRRVAHIPPPKDGPTWYLHRADLLGLLVEAAQEAGVVIRLGQMLSPPDVPGDLIIAADGNRSQWRTVVDGNCAPVFSGQLAWRAVIPAQGPGDRAACLSMGARAHMVQYPLRGGQLDNLVAVEERRDFSGEGWRQRGDPDEFQARFQRFAGEAGAAVSAVKEVHCWALHSRPVARRWQDGRIALLGDAAHPVLPFMAQGACLALEDAYVLAAALAGARDQATGLAQYEGARRARAARVMSLSAGNARRFHLRKPWAWAAQAVLGVGASVLAERLEWVYGYDATRAI